MFLDTANINEINQCFKTGVFKGITTNPTLLLKEKKDRFKQIDELLKTPAELLFLQLVGTTVHERYDDYKRLKAIVTDKQLGYKIPIDLVGLELIKKIKADNSSEMILGTAIYSADQAILAGLAGCDYVAPYVNRMENNNIDAYKEIEAMREFYYRRKLPCKILAASFKNTSQVIRALNAGAHTCTIPTDIFMTMINKGLATEAIKVFNEDGEKLNAVFL